MDPSSETCQTLQDRFGPAVWEGIAEKVLFLNLTLLCPSVRGSLMLSTKYSKQSAEADGKEDFLERMIEDIARLETAKGSEFTDLRGDDVHTSDTEVQGLTTQCAAVLEALPLADSRALSFDDQEKAELAAAAGVQEEDSLLRKRGNTGGRLNQNEGACQCVCVPSDRSPSPLLFTRPKDRNL